MWLHSAVHDNGAVDMHEDLLVAVNQLAQQKSGEVVRHSLLVNPAGLYYDANRLGGDYHLTTPSGRYFTFSVRRDLSNRKLLLAIVWN